MKIYFIFFAIALLKCMPASALQVKQEMQTSIGFFDACSQTLTYSFYHDKDYDIKTSVHTTGTFGTLYPFKAEYHAVGTYDKTGFKPQNYFYETTAPFKHKTKEITYKNGIPQRRISTKNEEVKVVNLEPDPKYASSIDLLSVFAMLAQKVVSKGECDLDMYSYNGKRYSRSVVKSKGKEKIKTPYFSGRAMKCEYRLENTKHADAGFLLDKDVPVYFWILRDKETDAPFIAKIEVESTPFGKLESITTKVEVKK